MRDRLRLVGPTALEDIMRGVRTVRQSADTAGAPTRELEAMPKSETKAITVPAKITREEKRKLKSEAALLGLDLGDIVAALIRGALSKMEEAKR